MIEFRYLITSALPYVNYIPHLGHLIGCILPADVFHRFLDLKKIENIYVCGTDEHGTPTEVAAIKEEVTPKELCDKYYEIHKKCYEWFDIDFSVFGRTSGKTHHETTRYIFRKLHENGYVFEQEVEMYYCPRCERFLPDRYITGLCPYCDSEMKGDQCDSCGHLVEHHEMISPKCAICGETPELKKSVHLFFDLPKLKDELKSWIENNTHWPEYVRNWSLSILENIKPRCITRDIVWGVSVPIEGFKNKVFYVWFDAPIGYISFTKELTDEWEIWWKSKDTKVVHFIGKDNIPFHTIFWPATLIGTKEGFTLPYYVKGVHYITWEGKKFSKSEGVGIFLDEVQNYPYPPDYWRFVLMSIYPENKDADFSWEVFVSKINDELVDTFGNFVYRVLSFIYKYFNAEVPEGELTEDDKNIIEKAKAQIEKVEKLFFEIKLRDALKEAMEIARTGNAYLNKEEPWKRKERAPTVFFVCANIVRILSVVLAPFIPRSCKRIQEFLGIENISWDEVKEFNFKGKINKPEILFKKVDQTQLHQ